MPAYAGIQGLGCVPYTRKKSVPKHGGDLCALPFQRAAREVKVFFGSSAQQVINRQDEIGERQGRNCFAALQ